MVTAYGREEVFRNADLSNFAGLLSKPVSATLLMETCLSALGVQHGDSPLSEPARLVGPDLSTIAGAFVLLVEDNELNQEVAMGLLREVGLRVDTADNGSEALQMLERTHYDLVLMDLQMPVLDGIAATKELRRNSDLFQLPVIAMTANALQADRERCIKAGMNDYVAKPIDPDDLYDVLLRWIPPTRRRTESTKVFPSVMAHNEVPMIAQVDTKLGLQRSLGRPALYLKLLRRFAENQAQLVSLLQAALESKDFVTAQRLVHTARGLCGNIGATQIQALAQELEHCIGQGQFQTVEAFSVAFQTLLTDIGHALPPEEPDHNEQLDSAPFVTVKVRLEELLQSDDPESLEYLDRNQQVLKSRLGDEMFQNFRKLVSQFDFSVALKQFREVQ